MSCNCCGQPKKLCRCPKGKSSPETPERAYIAPCTDCDPCRPCKSMVKICSFIAPTLTEAQAFRNSFVYNQEDDSVYYISDDGTPTRFGSSPMFIDNFNPDDKQIPRQAVFDFANNKAYVFNPEGEYITIDLAGAKSEPLELTLDFEEDGTWGETFSRSGFLVMGDSNVFEMSVPVISFVDKDGGTHSIEDVFAALEDGEDVVFSNIPLGWYRHNGAMAPLPATTNKMRVSSRRTTRVEPEEMDDFDAFTLEEWDGIALCTGLLPLGFAIIRKTYEDNTSEYIFTTQGISYSGAPA